MIDQRETTKRY